MDATTESNVFLAMKCTTAVPLDNGINKKVKLEFDGTKSITLEKGDVRYTMIYHSPSEILGVFDS